MTVLQGLWILGSALALLGAMVVVFARNPLRAALGLLLTFFSYGVLFVLLGSPFLGFVFIILYAGAIVTLFLFILMLLNLRQPWLDHDFSLKGYLTVLAVAALYLATLYAFSQSSLASLVWQPRLFRPEAVVPGLFGSLLIPFEILSVLLLVALLASFALARGKEEGA